jgi:HK97 gp10 family phage protein
VAKIRIKGADVLSKKLRALPEEIRKGAEEAVEDEIRETGDDLQRAAPYLSGELRDSIQEEREQGGLSGRVVITAEHADEVVYGTSSMEARDFVTPVVNRVRRRFPDRVRDAVKKEIGRR